MICSKCGKLAPDMLDAFAKAFGLSPNGMICGDCNMIELAEKKSFIAGCEKLLKDAK